MGGGGGGEEKKSKRPGAGLGKISKLYLGVLSVVGFLLRKIDRAEWSPE